MHCRYMVWYPRSAVTAAQPCGIPQVNATPARRIEHRGRGRVWAARGQVRAMKMAMSSAGRGASVASSVSLAGLTGSRLVVARVRVPPMLPRFGGLLVMRVYLDRHAALCMDSGGGSRGRGLLRLGRGEADAYSAACERLQQHDPAGARRAGRPR